MSDDQFNTIIERFGEVNSRLSSIEARLDGIGKNKTDRGDVFRAIFLVNGGFIAVVSLSATALGTFGIV